MERMRQPRRDPGGAGGLEPGHTDADAYLPPEAHARPEIDECPGVDTVVGPQVAVLPVERERREGRELGVDIAWVPALTVTPTRGCARPPRGHRRHDDCDGRPDRDARPHARGPVEPCLHGHLSLRQAAPRSPTATMAWVIACAAALVTPKRSTAA